MNHRRVWTACAVLGLAAGAAHAELDPSTLLAEIRAPSLDPQAAVSLRNVELELGPGVLEMQRGVLFPARAIAGRTVELVFVGQARFRLEPPDEIEAGQLELFTGERSLEAPVEEAVIVLARQDAVDELLRRAPPHELRPEMVERAESIHARWLEETERRSAGIESAIFKMLVGDGAFQDYFALWCHGFELGDFVYQLDPDEQEQITLAAFRPLEMTDWERLRIKHELRVQQRKKRWLDVRLEDLGSWDLWLSTRWVPGEHSPPYGEVGFESEHYELDVTLQRGALDLEGRGRLKLRATSGGRRVVRLELARDLRVSEVIDGQGRELFFFRTGGETAVLLPEAPAAGEAFTLEVAWGGSVLDWKARRSYDLQESSLWHPHCGTVDRATYDVTLRWPKRYDVLASGRLEAGGRRGRYRWERRRLDQPAIAFSFALGDYVIERARHDGVEITLAFQRSPRARLSPELKARTMAKVADTLQFFERAFGEYPLDELTVATVPRRFSQSYPGFITLADSLVLHPDPLNETTSWSRSTTIAHEMAHQWWGNKVGWWSYRDQWLSEGMANYSAMLYDGRSSGETLRLAMMSAGWRDSLSKTTIEGRTIESLGPIVLGNRLNSSRARNGYRTIVYRKGAVVLAMLARAVGEDRFLEMLRSFADAAQNKVLTTEAFLEALAQMSGLDLEGFARQYVYGTGIPEVYYGYDLQQDEAGHWTVQGEARLMGTPHYRYEVVRSEGVWDVLRRNWPAETSGTTQLMVPYQVTLEAGPRRQSGQVVLEGRRDAFRIETDDRPVDLRLDPNGEILAWFYSDQVHPKRFLHFQADDLAASGQTTAAEERYLEALESPAEMDRRKPLAPAPAAPTPAARLQDLEIRLALARLYLDQGRDPDAEEILDRVDGEIDAWNRNLFRMQRDALRSRIEIRRGDYEPAYRRLKKTLRLASPRRARVPWRHLALQMQLNAERSAVTEAYTFLAIAAHEQRDAEIFRWAMTESRARGVVLDVFGRGQVSF